LTPAPSPGKLLLFTTWTNEPFWSDWCLRPANSGQHDDLLIPAADDDESEANFRQFINSNIDFWIIMSKALLISMLRKGQTGNEILSILNMLADESDDTMSEPTLDEIEFWLVILIIQGLDRLSPIL